MRRRATVDLFVEDIAHESLLAPLIRRVADSRVRVRTRSARGGHPRALAEFEAYQKAIVRGHIEGPDLIVVATDTNCSSVRAKRREILEKTEDVLRDFVIPACPDPHIERWFFADPVAFEHVIGRCPGLRRRKCGRDFYKSLLHKTVIDLGHVSTLGGIEFAEELIEQLDFYRAGKNEPSLRSFLTDLTNAIARV